MGLNKIMAGKVSAMGHVPFSATNAQEVIDFLSGQSIDLMLLDYKLQQTTAEVLIDQLEQSGTLPPYIIVTGFGDEHIAVKMMKKGARDYWIKEGAFLDSFQERLSRVITDLITEKKLSISRSRVKRLEHESRKVLGAMSDPVCVINQERQLVFHNPSFTEIFGKYPRGKHCFEIIHQRKSPCPWCIDVKPETQNFSTIDRTLNIKGHSFQPAIGPVRMNGSGYKMIMFRDITDVVKAKDRAEYKESLMQSLLDSAQSGIIGINKDLKIVLNNRAALNLFNTTNEALKKQNFLSLFSQDKYLMRFNRLFLEIIHGKKNVLLGKNFRLCAEVNGKVKYLDCNMTVNKKEGDVPYLFILRDITEQHQAEIELLKQKNLLTSLIDNIPDNIFVKDTQLRFLMSNQTHCHHLGMGSEEELLGKTDRDFYPPEIAREYMQDEIKIINTGMPVLNRKEKTLDSQGRERWNLTSKIPVKDGYGKVTQIVGISRDITDIEIKEQEIRKSHRRLEGLLEITLSDKLDKKEILDLALDKIIELTDSEIGYIYFYDLYKEQFTLHNWSASTMEQCRVANKRTRYDLAKTGIWGEAVRQRRPVMVNDYSQDNPLKKGLPKGHVPIKRFLTIPVFFDQEIVAVAGVANKTLPYNQTDLIQMELLMDTVWKLIVQKEQRAELVRAKEKAEESERLKTVFMSTMSHELRTPLNAIVGFSQLIEQEKDHEETKQYARHILESGERLLSIIENIFFVSAIDGKHLHIVEEETSPLDIMGDILKRFPESRIPENVRIVKNYSEKDDTRIMTDQRMVGQILYALVDNALKFTPSGTITLDFQVLNKAIRFTVADTGIGIPPDKRNLVFEKFRQLDERASREYGGTGIGLYLVRRLMEVLQGKIRIEDNKPKGTVFTCEIPVKVIRGKTSTTPPAGVKGGEPAQKSKTVLIAEDNPMSAMLLKKIVADTGMVPQHAENGLEAVKYIQAKKPCDLILMDLNMPVMDGFEAIKRIKEIRDDIPIVVQTAYDSESGRDKALELKVTDFISKPVNRDQLVEKIRKNTRGMGIMI